MTFKNMLAAGLLAATAALAFAAEAPQDLQTTNEAAKANQGGKVTKPMKRHDHAAERSGPSAPKSKAAPSAPAENPAEMKRHDHMRDMK